MSGRAALEIPFRRSNQREQQRGATRRRLFAAAIDEFRREGVERANVARIARAAGVSRPAFYFHFPTKSHVLLELQWTLELQIVERLRGATTLRETLNEFADGLIAGAAEAGSPELFRDMLRVYSQPLGPLADQAVADQPLPLLEELNRRFATAAARSELRPGLEPEQACRLCLTSLYGYLTATGVGDRSRQDLRTLFSLFLA